MTYGPQNDAILLQTPPMTAPFGISSFTDDDTGKVSYNLNLAFKGMETEPKLAAFFDGLKQVDKAAVDHLTGNSEVYFGEQMPRTLVQYNYTPLVKPGAKDKKNPDVVYAPSMQIKLPPPPQPTASPALEIYDDKKQLVYNNTHPITDMDHLSKHSVVMAIFEMRAVWFVGKGYGLTTRLQQVLVLKKPQKLSGFAFEDDDGATNATQADSDDD